MCKRVFCMNSGSEFWTMYRIWKFSLSDSAMDTRILNEIFLRKILQFDKNTTTRRGVSESMDRRGCAILALELVPKNLIFA